MTEHAPSLLLTAAEYFGFSPAEAIAFPSHLGGRNLVYAIADDRILRISNLQDRTLQDYQAETEYVHYLATHGASVTDVIPSRNGLLVEIINENEQPYAVSMFRRAPGDQLADHGYQYHEDTPIEELWFNTGKTLGRMHALSKQYVSAEKRFDFFDKYNEAYFDQLIPDNLVCGFTCDKPIGAAIKEKLNALLKKLRALPVTPETYGMIHFDYSDGNYNIDYQSGVITVYDFDNCRTGWYLFDLANLWTHGVGWIAWNGDAEQRKAFMAHYFETVLEGYRTETTLDDCTLSALQLMIDAVRMENIIDEFEVVLADTGRIDCDGEQAYRLKGLLEDVPFMGFFSSDYDPENAFDLDIE